jgi:hypothetical protein
VKRRQITLAAVDRTKVKWSISELEARLRTLWQMRGRALVLPLTVRNLRSIAACRQRLDREGWTVRCQSQLRSETIAVYIHMRRYGARPQRGHERRVG